MLKLSPAGVAALAEHTQQLIRARGEFVFDLRAVFENLPDADRAALLAARPRDVFIAALKSYREAAPHRAGLLVRSAIVAALVPSGPKIYPEIATAQELLRREP